MEAVDRADNYVNQPEYQSPAVSHLFDYIADLGYAIRTNPRVAFVIGTVLGFVVIVVIGGLMCAGFNFFRPNYLSKISSCFGKLLIGGLVASVLFGVALWFRASLLQGNRRKLEREGFGDKSYQTALLLPSLITEAPL